ncbi:MAG: transcription termination factor Rho [Verrucomicrobiales bacterium]
MSEILDAKESVAAKKRAAKKTAAKKATAKKAATKRVKAAGPNGDTEAPPAPIMEAAATTAPAKKTARKVAKKTAAADTAVSESPVRAKSPRLEQREALAHEPPPTHATTAPPAPNPRPAFDAPPLPPPVSHSTPSAAPSRAPIAPEPPPRPEAVDYAEGAAAAPTQHRPPRHPHSHPASAPFPGQPGEPRFDKHPRKRRRRGRDRWKDRQGDGNPSPPGGPNAPQGGSPRQPHQNFQRPPRGEFQPRGPRVADDRGESREPFVPTGPAEAGSGLLEISAKGFGYLRQKSRNYIPNPQDIFVPPDLVRQHGLRDGVFLEGEYRMGHRGPQLTALHKINGHAPDSYKNLPAFEELTAINPSKRILLETDANRATTRIIDMIAPIGKGQRGLIVAPPRAGKTTLLQHIAEAVAQKYPEMKLIILLVDERPEEVTEITRALPQAEIYASSNDAEPKNHLRIAQVAIERAKRLVEAGEDVFIVLDSITRLARASNNAIMGSGSGRTMSGGIDARALELPRRLFAAARNTREAGSLTIVGTALIETNSKADELIFQEFKGTGNMELVLDRKIAQSYVYPAVDIFKSGTRREELLLPAHQLEKINLIRRGLAGHKPVEAVERLLHFVRRHPTNAQMLLDIPKAAFIDH